LDGHPLGGCGSGLWFSSRLYYPFGKGPGQHIIRALKIKSVRTNKATNGNQNYQKDTKKLQLSHRKTSIF